MRSWLTCLVSILFLNTAFAQEKYWILFKDKELENYDYRSSLSAETIKNRSKFGLPLFQVTDVPVTQAYLKAISLTGIQVLRTSKWLNAATAYMNSEQLSAVRALPFVDEVSPINNNIILTSTSVRVETQLYSVALMQMQSEAFLQDGLTGNGVKVGVIDAGFYKAETDKYLEHLFAEFKILEQRDFINPERKDIVTEKATDADGHGKRVLEMITGYQSEEKAQMGMAVNAQFYLARTENGNREYRGEEDNWIAAMEWMDSLGVRLISTSLGYAIKMDDPADNYKKEEMDGKTARITKAAQIAVDEKGIFLVVSAGNEGNTSSWKIVSAPADAEGVLSVGATRDYVWDRIGYSSIGPEFLPYIKPNVSCYSPDGTSFSAPAVAGFVACMMGKAPDLSNKQLKEVIQKSAHLYPYGNNYIGYGIPQAGRALELIRNPETKFNSTFQKEVHGKKFKLKMDKTINGTGVVFHKKNEFVVASQDEILIRKGKLRLNKKENTARATIAMGTSVIEIIWK